MTASSTRPGSSASGGGSRSGDPACWYWIRKLQARFFAGAYHAAIEAASNAQRLLWTSPSFLEVAEYELYAALAQAALRDAAPTAECASHQEALAAHHRQLQEWADNCPANFEDRAALIGAEIARIEGRDTDASRLYEQAITRPERTVHPPRRAHKQAAARFCAARGIGGSPRYIWEARACYLRWGAAGRSASRSPTSEPRCG
jgi:hypothetical protein